MIRNIKLALIHRGVRLSVTNADMPMEMRVSELSDFMTDPDRTLLIATNGYARGINIPTVYVVIQFGLPDQTTTFYYRATRVVKSGNLKKLFNLIMMFIGTTVFEEMENLFY